VSQHGWFDAQQQLATRAAVERLAVKHEAHAVET